MSVLPPKLNKNEMRLLELYESSRQVAENRRLRIEELEKLAMDTLRWLEAHGIHSVCGVRFSAMFEAPDCTCGLTGLIRRLKELE